MGRSTALACALIVGMGFGARAEDDAHRAAAERYAAVSDLGQLTREMTGGIAEYLPRDQRAKFMRFMGEAIDAKAIEAIMIDAMARYFSIEELDALTAFYGSELGRGLLAKLPAFQAEMIVTITPMVTRAAQEAQSRMDL